MSPNPNTATSELPTTLAWYRDAANWIVGLSAGAVAAALAYHREIQSAALGIRISFLAAGLLFVLAIVCGIQFYFWLTSYANQRELRDRLEEELKKEVHEPIKIELTKEVSYAAAEMQTAQDRSGFFYTGLLWTFHLGTISFAFVTGWLVSAPSEPSHSWTVTSTSCCSSPGRLSPLCGLRVDQSTGETSYLTLDSTKSYVWRRIEAMR